MMETEVDRELPGEDRGHVGKARPGAFNIRKGLRGDGRQSTEHIKIDNRTDGKSGIDIHIPGRHGGRDLPHSGHHHQARCPGDGVQRLYIGENCNVEIVAGCGIHNCGEQDPSHDGVHTFRMGKNSHVHYSEKHYGEGDGKGGKIMNPQTIVYLEEGASIQMDTVQIRGVDSTKRYTKMVAAARVPRPWSPSVF